MTNCETINCLFVSHKHMSVQAVCLSLFLSPSLSLLLLSPPSFSLSSLFTQAALCCTTSRPGTSPSPPALFQLFGSGSSSSIKFSFSTHLSLSLSLVYMLPLSLSPLFLFSYQCEWCAWALPLVCFYRRSSFQVSMEMRLWGSVCVCGGGRGSLQGSKDKNNLAANIWFVILGYINKIDLNWYSLLFLQTDPKSNLQYWKQG